MMLNVSRDEEIVRTLYAVERSAGELGRKPWEVIGGLQGIDIAAGCLYIVQVSWTTNSPGEEKYAPPGFGDYMHGYRVYKIIAPVLLHDGNFMFMPESSGGIRGQDARAIELGVQLLSSLPNRFAEIEAIAEDLNMGKQDLEDLLALIFYPIKDRAALLTWADVDLACAGVLDAAQIKKAEKVAAAGGYKSE